MRLVHSHSVPARPPQPELQALLDSLPEDQLRTWVEELARPRHFTAEPEQNRAAGEFIRQTFEALGYNTEFQGECRNMVAGAEGQRGKLVLVGAHYDSVPGCPGADDNASAVAALLGCAALCRRWNPRLPVLFVAFNREEDGLLGSREFVEEHLPSALYHVQCAHVLEMVGYASQQTGSQRVPTGLPIQLRPCGDFLGLLANQSSGRVMDDVLEEGQSYVPRLPLIGLEVEAGAARVLPVLARSDHVPFWEHNIPALMWTDTSEFRNPHYHRESDVPATLDFCFLRHVTQLLAAVVIRKTLQAE